MAILAVYIWAGGGEVFHLSLSKNAKRVCGILKLCFSGTLMGSLDSNAPDETRADFVMSWAMGQVVGGEP